MTDFLTPSLTHAIGISLQSTFARIALIEKKGSKLEVKEVSQIGIGDDDVNPLYNCLDRFQKVSDDPWLVSALTTKNVLTRNLKINLSKLSEIDEVLPFEAESLIPYPEEEGVLDRSIVSQDKNGTNLTLFHVHQDVLEKHLELLKKAKIDPEGLSCIPAGLAQFAHHLGMDGGVIVVDLELDHFTCCLCQHSVVLTAHHAELTEDPNEGATQENLSEAMRQKISLAILATLKNWHGGVPPSLLITGRGARYSKLPEQLATPLNLPIAQVEVPIEHLEGASAIGIAQAAISDASPVNFRKGDFAYSRPWKRLQKVGLTYFAACLFLAIALFLYGQSTRSYQLQDLKSNYTSLINTLGLSPDDAEALFQEQRGGTKTPLSDLTLESLQRRLRFFGKQIDEAPPEFPLNPGVPKVSQLLHWFAEYRNGESLRINQISYTMVKRPSSKRPQEPYQVRVSLELSGTPEEARGFRDYLIAPNAYISPYEEIKWSSSGGVYKAAFALQDRTLY